jgi:hypothetical protein
LRSTVSYSIYRILCDRSFALFVVNVGLEPYLRYVTIAIQRSVVKGV